ALVFTRTKHGADKVVKILQRSNIRAAAIHGNKSQNARQSALSDFKNGTLRVLVATDIAARGIDIDELTHVINFDMPNIPETYVHRIGRTGRAGNTGIAFSFSSVDERDELRDIQKLIGKAIPVIHEHPFVKNAHVSAPEPPQRQQRQQQSNYAKASGNKQSAFKPRRNNATSQDSGSGTHVRRGYGAQRSSNNW
ncbi:MAG: helicase-related protein, partial [Chitinophagaceae bacterium]